MNIHSDYFYDIITLIFCFFTKKGAKILFVKSVLVILLGIFFQGQTIMAKALNNNQVMQELKEGNSRAFESIYKSYCRPLRTYATHILQDADAAYEVVQDTFVTVWINRKKLNTDKSLHHYLLRAVHNNSLRLLQSEKARKAREEKAMCELEQANGEPSEIIHRLERLLPSIEQLPEQSKKVLRMSYWENKKSSTIAEELSISVRTVETILYKTKKKLRGKITLFL